MRGNTFSLHWDEDREKWVVTVLFADVFQHMTLPDFNGVFDSIAPAVARLVGARTAHAKYWLELYSTYLSQSGRELASVERALRRAWEKRHGGQAGPERERFEATLRDFNEFMSRRDGGFWADDANRRGD